MATVAAGEREIGEQLGQALVEDGALVATGLVGERAGEPGFADPGRAFDDEVVRRVDPVAVDEALQERAIQPARAAPIDVLDGGALAQPGMAQPGGELAVGALGGLALEQEGKARQFG